MIDFNINFLEDNINFEFQDLSTYTNLTVNTTQLVAYYPIINIDSSNNINLYSFVETLIIENLGDNATINTTTLGFPTLSDGVYRFDYNVTLSNDDVICLTKFFIKDNLLLDCRKNIINTTLTKNNCQECTLSIFDSMLESANNEASRGNYKEAESIISYLKKQCKMCNC